VYGYAFFTFTTGCWTKEMKPFASEHVLQVAYGGTCEEAHVGDAETGLRPNTRHRPMQMMNKPTSWMAACQIPRIKQNANYRWYMSHFGFRQGLPGWRYNVGHVDGSVNEGEWAYPVPVIEWAKLDARPLVSGNKQWGLPYGWRYVDNDLRSEKGVTVIEGFDGAFDER
jgi:hypothetical protein